MKMRSSRDKLNFRKISRYLQNLKIDGRKLFLAFTVITSFIILYVLFLVSQQVRPSNWVYTESFEENWMQLEYNANHWKPIQLPFLEVGKENISAYYRGEIEVTGIIKPDIVIDARDRVLEVYINGEEVKNYSILPIPGLNQNIALNASLFKPGKNLIAVKGSGGYYRIIGVSTLKTTLDNSKILILFLLAPALVFLVLGKKNLDSNKTALIVFLVLTLVFLKPIFQDFNYWGGRDWDFSEGVNAIPKGTILYYHQIPLWNPYISGGQPLLADPQSMWPSPLLMITLLFDVITSVKIQIILWYVIGLFGMYLLGKQLKLDTYACYLIAFILMFSSFYSLHMSEGHRTFSSMALLPWTFLFYLKALEDKKYAVLTALMMALMLFDGGLYMLAYAVLFLTLYAVFTSAKKLLEKKTGKVSPLRTCTYKGVHLLEGTKEDIINPLITLLIVGLLCSTLSAVKALPMTELSMKYPRLTEGDQILYNGYTPNYLYYAFLGTLQLKYAPEPMAGFRADWHEYGAYIGPIALLLAVGGILLYFRKQWPLALIILLGILLSFGTNKSEMMLWDILHRLPVFSSLRSPSRLILIALFPIAIFAGYMTSKIEEKKTWIAMILTVLVFYNLAVVDTPALGESFVITPRTINETKFIQTDDPCEEILIYNGELYQHFLQNQGIVRYTVSLAELSGVKTSVRPVGSPDYRGEVFLDSAGGKASMESFSPNRIVVEVNLERPDTLIVNQNYDNGWKTPEKEVYSKDGLIAVNVSQTDKEIVLYYSPTSFKIGLMITLLTILLIAHYHFIGKEKQNIKKYLKTLKDRRLIIYAILIMLISTYGVDFIQASGL